MTQTEFNRLVNADIKARVDAAAAKYAAELAEEDIAEQSADTTK
jgi:hypothetical protein